MEQAAFSFQVLTFLSAARCFLKTTFLATSPLLSGLGELVFLAA